MKNCVQTLEQEAEQNYDTCGKGNKREKSVTALLPVPRRKKPSGAQRSRGLRGQAGVRGGRGGRAGRSRGRELRRESSLRLGTRIPWGLLLGNIAGSCKTNNSQNSRRTRRHSGSIQQSRALSRNLGAIT